MSLWVCFTCTSCLWLQGLDITGFSNVLHQDKPHSRSADRRGGGGRFPDRDQRGPRRWRNIHISRLQFLGLKSFGEYFQSYRAVNHSLAVLLGAAAPQTAATSVVPVALAVVAGVEVEILEDVGGLRWFYAAATTVRSSVVTQWKLSCWESWIAYVYKDFLMVIQSCKGREMLNSWAFRKIIGMNALWGAKPTFYR